MKYSVRESLTGSGNWFVESDSDGHYGAFVALVRSESLARQIAAMLESGVLGEGVRYEFPEDTPEARKEHPERAGEDVSARVFAMLRKGKS